MKYNEIKEKACQLSVMAQSQDVRILADLVRDLATKCESLEDDLSSKMDDPNAGVSLGSLIEENLATRPVGSFRVDEIAKELGLKSQIPLVATHLRRLQGKMLDGRVLSSGMEGRYRMFTITQHNAAQSRDDGKRLTP